MWPGYVQNIRSFLRSEFSMNRHNLYRITGSKLTQNLR